MRNEISRMRVGVCVGGGPVAEGLALASEAGFGCVELDWAAVERQLLDGHRGVTVVQGLLREHDLCVEAMHVGSLSAERADQLRLQTARFGVIMAQVRAIGCRQCVVTAGGRTVEHFNILSEGLAGLGDVGESLGVRVVLANKVDTRVEDRRDLVALFLDSGLRRIGICVDTYQFHLAVVNPSDLTREHGGRIALVRVSDAMGTRAAPLGRGEINLRGLVQALQVAAYAGPLMVDHVPSRGERAGVHELRAARKFVEELVTEA